MNEEGTHYKVDILGDQAASEDSTAPVLEVEKRIYTVTAKEGIFKAGKLWPEGSDIELPVLTGENLIKANDVKEKSHEN